MRSAIRTIVQPAWCALIATLAVGCHSSQRTETGSNAEPGKGFVTGTASYLERVEPPKDGVFEAFLQDVSRPDAPATAIGRAAVEDPSQVPITFSIDFDSGQIDVRRNYAVRARILEDGTVTWVSDRAHPVLTQGNGTSVRMVMRRVGMTEQTSPEGGAMLLGGELTYLTDVARLTECTSRRIYPVSREGAFPEMHRVYTKMTRALGAPLFVTFEGLIVDRTGPTGSGTTATVVVTDFVDAWPSQSCAAAAVNAPLLETRWHIIRIGEARTSEVIGHREPTLILTRSGDSLTYSATVGCNSIGGSAKVDGDQITFGRGMSTMMSCGAPLDSLERRLSDALARTVHWQVLGGTLEFEDTSGETVATFELRRRP